MLYYQPNFTDSLYEVKTLYMEINTLRIPTFILCLMAGLPAGMPVATPTQALRPITVQLSWTNQAEFAGLYAADQLVYFTDEGLQISFLEGGPKVDFITPVVEGTAQFGIAQPADLVLARAGNKPVRSIAVIYLDDYGIHFYGDVLITTDDLIAMDPDLVKRFTRAALKSWTYAVENPENIGVFVQKYNPGVDPAVEIDKMRASIPLINTGEDYIGWMKTEVWSAMEQTLREQGVLENMLDIEQVYTRLFLEETYRK